MTESVPTRYAPLLTPIAAAFDRLVSIPLTGSGRQRKRRVEAVPPARRLQILDDTARAYRDARPLTDVDRFFPPQRQSSCPSTASVCGAAASKRGLPG